jgi:mannose/fructose/N-acetylgalactosamine-specific phosphotransferase system component IIC
MHKMPVYINKARPIAAAVDYVVIPYFLVQSSWLHRFFYTAKAAFCRERARKNMAGPMLHCIKVLAIPLFYTESGAVQDKGEIYVAKCYFSV